MRLVSVDKFLPRVLPFAENLPAFVARRAVSDACRQLMEDSLCVTETYRFTTVPRERKYTLSLPYGLSPVLMKNVMIKKPEDTGWWQLSPVTAEQLDTYAYPVSWRGDVGGPRVYLFRSPDELVLVPAPQEAFEVSCECAATIKRDAFEVPETLYEDYADVVVNGALSRVFSLAGQTWSDAGLSATYGTAFRVGVSQIRLEANKDYTKVGGRVIYNRWC